MRNKICDVISTLIGIVGLVAMTLFAMAVQSTKSWETFLPNVGITLLMFSITMCLIVLVQKIKK